jgi:hypothetical protein
LQGAAGILGRCTHSDGSAHGDGQAELIVDRGRSGVCAGYCAFYEGVP